MIDHHKIKSTEMLHSTERLNPKRKQYSWMGIVAFFLLFSVFAGYIFFINKETSKLRKNLNTKDSIILSQQTLLKETEKKNKNLELYTRDLNAQKLYYENLQPFHNKSQFPYFLDLDSTNIAPFVKNNLSKKSANLKFILPLKGFISSYYSEEENHKAIDFVAKTGEPVKAIENGYVIFTDWTPDTGFVIILQHKNHYISIYKHNLDIHKKIGEKVTQGEVISSVGNTGEFTTGPHLHLEIWKDGKAIDPAKYLPLDKNDSK